MRIRLLLIVLLGSVSGLFAQTPEDPKTVQTNENLYEDAGLLYRNEADGGLIVNSHGFGLNYRRCKHVTYKRKAVWEFEMVNYKHPKEVRVTNPF